MDKSTSQHWLNVCLYSDVRSIYKHRWAHSISALVKGELYFIVSPEKVERKWIYTAREVLLLCNHKDHWYSRSKPLTSMYILTKPCHKKNTIHLAFWSKNIAVLYFPFSQICIEGDSIEVNHPYGSLSTFFLANVEGKMGMIQQSH